MWEYWVFPKAISFLSLSTRNAAGGRCWGLNKPEQGWWVLRSQAGLSLGQRVSQARRWVRSSTQVNWQNWREKFLRVLEKTEINEVPLVPPFCLCSEWGFHGCGIQAPNKLFGLLNFLFSGKLLVSSWWAWQSLGTVRCCRLVQAESLLLWIRCFSSVNSRGGTAHF